MAQVTLLVDGARAHDRDRRSRHAAALRAARRAQLQQSTLRLRPRPVRRLHGADRRPRGPLLHHAGVVRRRPQGHDARRHRHAGEAASGAGRLDRGAGQPVRLLHQRLDPHRRRTARAQSEADRRADQGGVQRPDLPLRHPGRGPQGGQARRASRREGAHHDRHRHSEPPRLPELDRRAGRHARRAGGLGRGLARTASPRGRRSRATSFPPTSASTPTARSSPITARSTAGRGSEPPSRRWWRKRSTSPMSACAW